MPYCSDCGSKLESIERFCGNCGKGQQGDVMPVEDRLITQGAKSKWLFSLVGLVALILIVGAVFFFTTPDIHGRYSVSGPDMAAGYMDLVIEGDGTLTLYLDEESYAIGTWEIENDMLMLMIEGVPLHSRIDGNRIVVYDPTMGYEVMTLTRQ